MLFVDRFMLICVGVLPLDSDSSGCASQCIACEFEIGKHSVITWHIFVKFLFNILLFYIICDMLEFVLHCKSCVLFGYTLQYVDKSIDIQSVFLEVYIYWVQNVLTFFVCFFQSISTML